MSDQHPLIEVAEKLCRLYEYRNNLLTKLIELKEDKREREMTLTPVEGWTGKNDVERFSVRDKRFSMDEVWVNINDNIRELETAITNTNVMIEIAETERRALEWVISERSVSIREKELSAPKVSL